MATRGEEGRPEGGRPIKCCRDSRWHERETNSQQDCGAEEGRIPDDGFADGGAPYTDEEMDIISRPPTYNHCQSCGARVPTNSLTSVDRDSTSPNSGLMSVCKKCHLTTEFSVSLPSRDLQDEFEQLRVLPNMNARRIAKRIVDGTCPTCGAENDIANQCGCDPNKPGPMPPGRRIVPNPRGKPTVDYWLGDYKW